MEKDSISGCFRTPYELALFIPNLDLFSGLKFDKEINCDSFFFYLFEREIKNSICLYTNGSKNPGSEYTGFAVVTLNENISTIIRTPGFLSIFTLEALAIIETLRISEENNYKEVTIFSDSKSVLTALKSFPSGEKSSLLIYQIKDKIRSLTKSKCIIKLVWIEPLQYYKERIGR